MHSEISGCAEEVLSRKEDSSSSCPAVISARGPKALFLLDAPSLELIYGAEERGRLQAQADFYAPPQTSESIRSHPGVLAEAEVIFSGWKAPIMDERFLAAAPNLRAVFYGAGTTGYFTTPAFWDRQIVLSSAYAANAVPVAEYTLGVILLSLKHFWHVSQQARLGLGWGDQTRRFPGGFRSTVALIGCGMIARRVIALLKSFDIRCLVQDPFLAPAEAAALGVELCTLDEAFRRADIVSLHASNNPQTRGMITGRHFSSMKEGATFINTARGPIVREGEMIEVLRRRSDLTAVLDVCDPEPAPAGSPLLELANVTLTSHISGSHGPECERLGSFMVEEFTRYLAGEPLRWQITQELAARLA